MALTNRADIWQSNVFGTVALFDQAVSSGVRRTIALSSMSAYPGTRQLYGRAKLAIGVGGPGSRVVRRPPGLGLRSRLGWDGRDAAPAGRPSGASRLRSGGASVHRLRARFRGAPWSPWPGPSTLPALPVGIAHPDPVLFTELLTSFAASMGKPPPRFVRTPPMVVYGALRAAELLPVKLPVRADSLLGLVRPAPNVPNLEVLDQLGVVLQPFALSDGKTPKFDGAVSASQEHD